ncbi:MAG: hypothetical protein L3J11_02610 [Draconibacterium sp.]|nr:hypothetical protein [Draconibacterium sp.]
MISLNIRKQLFWDVDIKRLSDNDSKRFIIERVFNFGNLNELIELFNFYGKETIKKEIVKAGDLDNKTLSFASIFFNINQKDFKCFTKKQLNQEL